MAAYPAPVDSGCKPSRAALHSQGWKESRPSNQLLQIPCPIALQGGIALQV